MKTHHCVSMVPLFNHLSGEDQEQIDRLVSHRHFHKGETIWQPGNDPLLIIVARGTLKVYMISSSGREQLLRILNPGDYEGVNTLLGAMAQDIFIDSIQKTRPVFSLWKMWKPVWPPICRHSPCRFLPPLILPFP